MSDKRRTRAARSIQAWLLCLAAATCTGCNQTIRINTLAGLRDGAITTATGIINAFFDRQVAEDPSTAGEGGGDDLFVRM